MQLVMLSDAALRDDRSLTPPEKLNGGAAHKVAARPIAAGLVKEVKAKAGMPVWRRDEQNRLSFALGLTAAGATAISVDPEDSAEPAGDKQRPGIELDRSPTLAQSGRTACWRARCAERPSACAPSHAPRLGTKLEHAVEMLRATKGLTIAELSEAMSWLPHATRAAERPGRRVGLARMARSLSVDLRWRVVGAIEGGCRVGRLLNGSA
jgi:Protein of unknown function (DUF3489)